MLAGKLLQEFLRATCLHLWVVQEEQDTVLERTDCII
jgi:hypothetical protein